jgi:nucleoside-diphosphate-sugar epimerase
LKKGVKLDKIIVIGGTGFLGYHISKHFLKKKFNVISISRNKPKKFRRLRTAKYIFSDISKKKNLLKILKPHLNSKYVINVGGEIDHKRDKKVYNSHYIGVKNLTNIFLNTNLVKFIQIGSSMEYGKSKSPQFEGTSPKPISSYGKSKLLATNYLINMYKKKNFPSLIVRPYQVYGPAQEEKRLIPFIISQSLKGKNFPCSSGNQFRDFLYVSDFIKCLDLLIKKKIKLGQIYNIGTGKGEKIKNVINLINKKIKFGKPVFNKIKLREEEQKYLFPSIFKIKKALGWMPKIKFNTGINKTIRFYKKIK